MPLRKIGSALRRSGSLIYKHRGKILEGAAHLDAMRALRGKAPKFTIPASLLSSIASPNTGESAAAGQQTPAERQLEANIAKTITNKRSGTRSSGGAAPARGPAGRRGARNSVTRRAQVRTSVRRAFRTGKTSRQQVMAPAKRTVTRSSRATKWSPAQLRAQAAFAAKNRGRKGPAK